MLVRLLKTTMLAAVLGLAAIAASTSVAVADTFKTSCNGDDCVRIQCDDWGRDCFKIGYFDRHAPPYEYRRTYTEYPDTSFGIPRDLDNDYDSDGGLYYHYKNHFDPDNDYDPYPG